MNVMNTFMHDVRFCLSLRVVKNLCLWWLRWICNHVVIFVGRGAREYPHQYGFQRGYGGGGNGESIFDGRPVEQGSQFPYWRHTVSQEEKIEASSDYVKLTGKVCFS